MPLTPSTPESTSLIPAEMAQIRTDIPSELPPMDPGHYLFPTLFARHLVRSGLSVPLSRVTKIQPESHCENAPSPRILRLGGTTTNDYPKDLDQADNRCYVRQPRQVLPRCAHRCWRRRTPLVISPTNFFPKAHLASPPRVRPGVAKFSNVP